jgi:lysophospholipase L1-like esterase
MKKRDPAPTKGLWWKRCLLVVLAVGLALGMAEVALRVLEPRNDARIMTSTNLPSGHRYIQLIPDSSGVLLGRPVSINAAGYRGRLRETAKPPGVVRLGAFGDSHTFGWGADDNSSYPAALERLLNGAGKGRYEVLNFGVGGHNLRQVLHHAREHAFRYHLDVVLLTFHQGDLLENASRDLVIGAGTAGARGQGVVQDVAPASGYRLRQIRDRLCRLSALARFLLPRLSGLARRTGLVKNAGVTENEMTVIQRNLPLWQEMQKEILAFVADARREGSRVVLVLFPHMQDFARHPAVPLHEALTRWGREHGVPCIDLLPAFRGQKPGALAASLLDRHPNERGYALAAGEVARVLETFLTPSASAVVPDRPSVISEKP